MKLVINELLSRRQQLIRITSIFTYFASKMETSSVENTPTMEGRKVFEKTTIASNKGSAVLEKQWSSPETTESNKKPKEEGVLLFFCGDVMTGRGVDQILPFQSKPQLFEQCVRDANDYVWLAEQRKGPLPKKPVDFAYPWGDALPILAEMAPQVSIINLETAVTTSDSHWPSKGIHYRMHPGNVPCLSSARVDCCVLANNHVLDWGHEGLLETLDSLHAAGIQTTGAGRNAEEAAAPAIIELPDGKRVLIFACADESSGVPGSWAATESKAGVNFLHDGISGKSAEMLCQRIAKVREITAKFLAFQEKHPKGDIVVLSIHWGGNWGFHVTRQERQFAHKLIDSGQVDIVHGHSSHHAKGIEVYNGKLILYGCGDFLNDYEGISGHDEYHDEFTLMYFPIVSTETGKLLHLQAVPMLIEHMRLNRGSKEAATWLYVVMKRECAKFGLSVERDPKTDVLTFCP